MTYSYNSPLSPTQLKTPEGGWLEFYENLSDERREMIHQLRNRDSEELASLEARRAELLRELHQLDSRQSWLEGLLIVAKGLGTLRTRRVGMSSTLNVYRYEKSSPTGVLHSGASAPDDEQHRREAALVSTVYAGAY